MYQFDKITVFSKPTFSTKLAGGSKITTKMDGFGRGFWQGFGGQYTFGRSLGHIFGFILALLKKDACMNLIIWLERFGRALGRFGYGLWSVLGGVWRLLAALGPHIGIIFGCLNLDCFVEGLLEAPELDFEGIWESLGGILGGFWERLGSFFRQLML